MKNILTVILTITIIFSGAGAYAFGKKKTAPVPLISKTSAATENNLKQVKEKKTKIKKVKENKEKKVALKKTKPKQDITPADNQTAAEGKKSKTKAKSKKANTNSEAKNQQKNKKVKKENTAVSTQTPDMPQMTDKQRREVEYVQNYYQSMVKHRSKLALKLNPNLDIREVRASHILVKKRSDAVKIRKDIMDGKITFEDAARMYSLCPSGPYGGDLGFFDRKKMAQQFADTAFDLNIGEISMPVGTKFGWHLIKTTDKR